MAVDTSPGRRGYAVTPSDVSPAIPVGRAILVGVAGNVAGQLVDDTSDTVYPLPAGISPLQFRQIKNTGTTATGLVVIF